jgi:DNA processing protein
MDRLYPPESADLAREIASQGGVISEYPLGKQADRTTFPYRNRVINGLCMGVVVVEADVKSGALNTADHALEEGRTVFAVPGRVDAASSRGAHRLIKGGARLVEGVDDILEEFSLLIPPDRLREARPAAPARSIRLSEEEQRMAEVLTEGRMDVDTLARRSGLNISRISALLVSLEMKRVVRMLPGRQVELTVTPEVNAGG